MTVAWRGANHTGRAPAEGTAGHNQPGLLSRGWAVLRRQRPLHIYTAVVSTLCPILVIIDLSRR
jgi:hypothetical protein